MGAVEDQVRCHAIGGHSEGRSANERVGGDRQYAGARLTTAVHFIKPAVGETAVADSVGLVRASGIQVKRKPEDLYDNSFVNNLEKSGFLKELWGNDLRATGR